jgi:predicted ATPase
VAAEVFDRSLGNPFFAEQLFAADEPTSRSRR